MKILVAAALLAMLAAPAMAQSWSDSQADRSEPGYGQDLDGVLQQNERDDQREEERRVDRLQNDEDAEGIARSVQGR